MKADPNSQSGDNPSGAGGEGRQIVDLDFLRGLISAVDDSGIDSLEITRGGTRIRVAKTPPAAAVSHVPAPQPQAVAHTHAVAAPSQSHSEGAAPAPAVPAAKSNLLEIKSPMVGTFYRAPSPEAPSYVEVGTRITKGQTLCVLEAMKLMNELESEVQGVVKEICVGNAEPIEYGQVLFRIEPEA